VYEKCKQIGSAKGYAVLNNETEAEASRLLGWAIDLQPAGRRSSGQLRLRSGAPPPQPATSFIARQTADFRQVRAADHGRATAIRNDFD